MLRKTAISILKMAVIERNSYARFRQNSSSSFIAITVKIKAGCQWPYLSTDRNHFRADTTRPPGEHLRQVSRKSDQWYAITRKQLRTDVWRVDGPLCGKFYLSVELKKMSDDRFLHPL